MSNSPKKISVPRGTSDILPDQSSSWTRLESLSRKIANAFGYREIRTPMYEETILFKRSLGQTSEVVNKQLLEIAENKKDTGEMSEPLYALRPEGTAAVVRSYVENNLQATEGLSKLFYIGPMFRGERPQKGRLRQFHQIGVEVIGAQSASPYLDVEVIALSVRMLKLFGLKTFKLKINSPGSAEDKDNFSKALRSMLEGRVKTLCEDCQSRFERNVFRILDCKNEGCRSVVVSLNISYDHLSQESQKYFGQVQTALTDLNIAYDISPLLVRGLDYYTHTVFEIIGEGLGSQYALGAGGRYNGLVEQLGGQPADAVGFALGMERVLLALGENQLLAQNSDVFLVALDEVSLAKAFTLVHDLRQNWIASDMSYRSSSMKSQMRLANKSGAQYVIILGDEEMKSQTVTLKTMANGEQEKISWIQVVNVLHERLNIKNTVQ